MKPIEKHQERKKHILSMLVENESGALSRIAGLFSARGYNIQELSVAPTEDPSLSRLNMVSYGNDYQIEQITKHLNRLIDVVKVVDLVDSAHIEREVMLIKVLADSRDRREEVKRMADIFRASIVDVTESIYTIQVVGDSGKIDAFISAVSATESILETVRSGTLGIFRGNQTLTL